MFFTIKKIYLLFFITSITIYSKDYLKNILSVECINQENMPYHPQTSYIYAHNKFCKVINFYFHKKIKIQDTKKILELTFLILYNDENEVEIIPQNKKLKNEFQWHIILNNNIAPISIIKKEKDLEDSLLFGKNHIPYGEVYIISFDITNLENFQPLCGTFFQPNRKVTFNLK